jgi:hypothetical protein
MIQVLLRNGGESKHISLHQFLNEYHQNPPKGWWEYIYGWVNTGFEIETNEDYELYLKKLNLKWFYIDKVKILYENLKTSKYGQMFHDDIIRFISHLYGLGFLERSGFSVDIHNPNLDTLLTTKFVFHSLSSRNLLSDNEMFSIMDIQPLWNGMNAIRAELLYALKW